MAQASFQVDRFADVAFVRLERNVLSVELVDEIGAALSKPLRKGQVHGCVIDMSSVVVMNSAGLGALIDLANSLQLGPARLALVGCQPNILEVFRLTCVDQFFSFYDDETAAFGAFGLR